METAGALLRASRRVRARDYASRTTAVEMNNNRTRPRARVVDVSTPPRTRIIIFVRRRDRDAGSDFLRTLVVAAANDPPEIDKSRENVDDDTDLV